MQRFATVLFLAGFLFLLSVITGILPMGYPPMLVGQVVLANAADETGSANIVTAVVLGYRGIDTLGELSILFAAATAGGLVLGRSHRANHSLDDSAGFIFKSASELLFPLLIVTGLYIVLHGHLTPGGGFQGGVILATAFFLPVLARPSQPLLLTIGIARLAAGLHFDDAGIELLQPGSHTRRTPGHVIDHLKARHSRMHNLRFARHHHDIVAKYGRFPHRNEALGRESSEAEIEYLSSKQAFTG